MLASPSISGPRRSARNSASCCSRLSKRREGILVRGRVGFRKHHDAFRRHHLADRRADMFRLRRTERGPSPAAPFVRGRRDIWDLDPSIRLGHLDHG